MCYSFVQLFKTSGSGEKDYTLISVLSAINFIETMGYKELEITEYEYEKSVTSVFPCITSFRKIR